MIRGKVTCSGQQTKPGLIGAGLRGAELLSRLLERRSMRRGSWVGIGLRISPILAHTALQLRDTSLKVINNANGEPVAHNTDTHGFPSPEPCLAPGRHTWVVTHTADAHAKNSNVSLTQISQFIQSSFQISCEAC
jgi:hypothetical protein